MDRLYQSLEVEIFIKKSKEILFKMSASFMIVNNINFICSRMLL
jgi:hypothetical protein